MFVSKAYDFWLSYQKVEGIVVELQKYEGWQSNNNVRKLGTTLWQTLVFLDILLRRLWSHVWVWQDRNIWQGVATPPATFVVNKTGILSQILIIPNPHQVFVVPKPQHTHTIKLKFKESFILFVVCRNVHWQHLYWRLVNYTLLHLPLQYKDTLMLHLLPSLPVIGWGCCCVAMSLVYVSLKIVGDWNTTNITDVPCKGKPGRVLWLTPLHIN